MRWIFALLFMLSACSETQRFVGECQNNNDCPVGAFCKGGLCACRTDEACKAGEVCNSQGVCQQRAGCRRNAECDDPSKAFCDIATGNCVDKIVRQGSTVSAGCGASVHCDPGFVCDATTNRCVMGCETDADCPLYRVCSGATASAPGRCLAGVCSDRSFCPYGQVCANSMCGPSGNPNHCKACNNMPGECGTPNDFCLVNPNHDPANPATGSRYFCGVSCDPANDSCPSGYRCGGVQLLTQDLCMKNSDCCAGGNAGECCPDGQRGCGADKRVCVAGEGDVRGACTCLRDQDCTIDEIPPLCAGSCGGLGLRLCLENSDCQSLPCERRNMQCQWPQGRSCMNDSQCDPLPLCVTVQGQAPFCVWSNPQAPVACRQNSDCLCNTTNNQCFGTGRPCRTAADCTLSCRGGGCVLGAACAPEEGLSCQDVR